MQGTLKKLKSELVPQQQGHQVNYSLPICSQNDEQYVPLNELLGKPIKLVHTGNIYCSSCGKKTKKSYSQGHCYVCMSKKASCDMCILKPETCHYHLGTCREPQWGEENCMISHFVYLSNTSALKVGITRHTQVPTRWIDQGATQAVPIFAVNTRLQSGLVETALAQHIGDKTNWRALLKGNNDDLDLKAKAQELIPQIEQDLAAIKLQYGEDAITALDEEITQISYPVIEFPTKITSFNFDKKPEVEGTLMGIKGQYLLLDTGVINIRKFTSYEIEYQSS